MNKRFEPVYIRTIKENKFDEKIREAYKIMESCVLCGRYCRVNRIKGQAGFCKTGKNPIISSFGPHHGEEAPLVGFHGSGTIFLTYCNLGCIFCQNYDISHMGEGETYTIPELAKIILKVKKMGCHNINFVTPTHQMPMLLEAVKIASEKGLDLPIVWNCGGYESLESLAILDGVVDIYMPDFKFWDEEPAKKYLHAPDYAEVARKALVEMHRQVGDLIINDEGIAERGLLVRHLVMPENLAGTDKFIKWLASEISPNTYINVMAQYRPCYKASHFKEIDRSINGKEFDQALKWAKDQGLRIDREVAPRWRRIIFFDI